MSNTLHFTGRVAKAPTLTRHGDTSVAKFALIRNEYAGKDHQGNKRDDRKVAIPFVAFDDRAEALAKHAMEGDQIIIEARIENNDYVPTGSTDKVYGYNFVVASFDFGAPGPKKREQLAKAGSGN